MDHEGEKMFRMCILSLFSSFNNANNLKTTHLREVSSGIGVTGTERKEC